MRRSLLPAGLVVATAFADFAGAHTLAYYVLLAAIIATAVVTLDAFGRLVELTGDAAELRLARWEAVCSALALALALVSAAVRSDGAVPPVGVSALVACLALVTAQSLLALPRAIRL